MATSSDTSIVVTLKGGHVAPLAAIELLLDLEQRGFRLKPVDGGLLRVTPHERLTAKDRTAIRYFKAELMQLIAFCDEVV
jgi:hypothetical protein